MKQVLILERCTSGLNRVNESAGEKRNKYILDGTFTEFNRVNRNKRVYSADSFLPHLNEMMGRRDEFGVVYGEFDHPETFDIQLKHTSHIITSANYIANENRVHGEIRLLTTHWGKEARALVDDECPIFVSSRAAGVVESNGHTRLNRLFTYDIVADPGFSSARMSAKNVNESYGMTDDPNIQLYDLGADTGAQGLFERNANDMVTRSQMREYQEYLLGQITELKGLLNESIKNGGNSAEVVKLSELYENTQLQLTKMREYLDSLSEKGYVAGVDSSLLEKVTVLENTNTNLNKVNEANTKYIVYMAETMDNLISFVERIAENVELGGQFTEYVAAHVKNGHLYAQHIAKGLNANSDRVNSLTEKLGHSIEYTQDLAVKTKGLVAFSEYTAEHLKGAIEYTEFVKENLEDNTRYLDYAVNAMDGIIDHNIAVTERVNLLTEAARVGNGSLITEAVVSIESPVTALGLNAESNGDEDDTDEDDSSIDASSVDAAQPDAQVTGIEGDAAPAQDDVNVVPSNDEGGEAQGAAAEEAEAVSDETEAPAQGDVQPVATDEPNTDDVQTVEDPSEAQPDTTVDAPEISPDAGMDGDNPDAAIVAQPAASTSATVVEVGEDSVSIKRNGRETIIKLSPAAAPANAPVQESITNKLNAVIEAAKKQKAIDNDVPAFFNFLSESQVEGYKALGAEDQEKVVAAINESPYYTTDEVLRRFQKALSPPEPTLNEKLLSAIPEDIKPQWDALSESQQMTVLNTARFYANTLNSAAGVENFWRTRPMAPSQSKVVVLSESVHDDSLSEAAIAFFQNRFRSL